MFKLWSIVVLLCVCMGASASSFESGTLERVRLELWYGGAQQGKTIQQSTHKPSSSVSIKQRHLNHLPDEVLVPLNTLEK